MSSPAAVLDVLTRLVETGLQPAIDGGVTVTESFGRVVATVEPADWIPTLTAARDQLGADFFDWLTGVDELADGFTIAAFVCSATGAALTEADTAPGAELDRLRRGQGLIVKTRVPREKPELPSAAGVYRGADWHERETYEMFGVFFTDHPNLKPLLLPDGFEGTPLRKDFVLATRVAKAWPGAKEPGESDHTTPHGSAPRGSTSPGRRRMLPPGVPGDDWLKPLPAPSVALPDHLPDPDRRPDPAGQEGDGA
jgi:NADH-quinone oxidoreductase subunit C